MAAAWLRAGLAFFVLNTLLTFENRWPGLGVLYVPRLSFELCLGLALLAAWVAWRGVPSARAIKVLAMGFVLLVAVRYLDVTAPAVMGRPVNLYWDGRHALELLRVAGQSWSWWHVTGVLAALLLGAALLLQAARGGIAHLAHALATLPALRRGSGLAAGAFSLCFVAYVPDERDTRWFFSLPLTPTVMQQASLLTQAAWPGQVDATLGPGPAFDTELHALRTPEGPADVLLVFAESYGAVAFDDAALETALAPARTRLLDAIDASGRQVVSARVRAATFGGGSWLSHASLLSGIDTADPGRYNLLLASDRPTLVRHFVRHGYRTVGWMPGIKRPWPEGAFYGFERFADDARLGYSGPDVGYWRIPDHAAMELLQAQELGAGPRKPVFAVFPTTSTHAPFHPLPTLPGEPAADGDSDGTGNSESTAERYTRSLRYQFHWLARHLAATEASRQVLIVVGDHQPPGGLAGRDASWDVPVHVIADDPALIRRFEGLGFTAGLQPGATALGDMHELTRALLLAFDGRGEQH
jgi:hypothetical protein